MILAGKAKWFPKRLAQLMAVLLLVMMTGSLLPANIYPPLMGLAAYAQADLLGEFLDRMSEAKEAVSQVEAAISACNEKAFTEAFIKVQARLHEAGILIPKLGYARGQADLDKALKNMAELKSRWEKTCKNKPADKSPGPAVNKPSKFPSPYDPTEAYQKVAGPIPVDLTYVNEQDLDWKAAKAAMEEALRKCDIVAFMNARDRLRKIFQAKIEALRKWKHQQIKDNNAYPSYTGIMESLHYDIRVLKDYLQAIEKRLEKCYKPKDGADFGPKIRPQFSRAPGQDWQSMAKQFPQQDVAIPDVPEKTVPRSGEEPAQPVPPLAGPGSSGSPSLQTPTDKPCDVETYKRDILSSANRSWRAKKPLKKGMYTARFTYRLNRQGLLIADTLHMVQSSGDGGVDQSAYGHILQVFGSGGEAQAQPLPDCFEGQYLDINHTFRVNYN